MTTQDVSKLQETLRHKEAKLAKAKSEYDELFMECSALRSAISILDQTGSELDRQG